MSQFDNETSTIVKINFDFSSPSRVNTIAISSPKISYDANAIVEEARTSNLSYHYSGRHDHGELPQLKTGSKHDKIIGSLLEAKELCGNFLTTEINKLKSIEDNNKINNNIKNTNNNTATNNDYDDDNNNNQLIKKKNKKPRIGEQK